MIAVFGGGEIATQGIIPAVGGVAVGKDVCDVRDPDAVARAMAELRPGVVIYTAGISHVAPVAGSNPRQWREELEVNLLGAYHVARAAVLEGAETLIFVASLAGLYGKPEHSGYSASKSGLISLVQSLALEGHNAYAISPGRVHTGMRERDYPGEDPRTRLDPRTIGGLVQSILDGGHTAGDNLVIRMRGHEILPLEVHRGDGWQQRLKVGEPKLC